MTKDHLCLPAWPERKKRWHQFTKEGTYGISPTAQAVRECERVVGKSKKLAILAQKEVEVQLAKKKLGWEEIRDPTFYDFQEKYLQYLKANTRPTTYVRYRKALQHFTDFLTSYGTASVKLSQISFQLIEEYKQERSKAVKPLTVNVELKVLKALYNFALECRCARENPVSEVSFYKEIEKKPRFLPKEEIKKPPRRG